MINKGSNRDKILLTNSDNFHKNTRYFGQLCSDPVCLKIGYLLLPSELCVNLGIQQGAITSSTIYNITT